MVCSAVGHFRELTIDLPTPFDGTTVYDLAGYVHFLSPPAGLVEVHGLPRGWVLRSERSVEESPTGAWQRTYSPVADPSPTDSRVDLYQSFDGPMQISNGGERTRVSVGGQDGVLWSYPLTGELLLTWMLGPDGLAVVANEREFTPASLLALAESIGHPMATADR